VAIALLSHPRSSTLLLDGMTAVFITEEAVGPHTLWAYECKKITNKKTTK
jgi:hypothetical protein